MSRLQGEVAEQWARGLAPSQIDRVLGLGAGTSRSVIVGLWAADKAGCGDAPLARRDFGQCVMSYSPGAPGERRRGR